MYQRCFDNASETLFVAGKTPRLSRFAISDDPKWESGHHVHDNETELIYVKKGVARFTIDSSCKSGFQHQRLLFAGGN